MGKERSATMEKTDETNSERVVEHRDGKTVASDDELRSRLEEMLRMSASVANADIEVTVENRAAILSGAVDAYWKKLKVTLSGTVPNWPAYRAVLNTAEYTSGVLGVNSMLKVL